MTSKSELNKSNKQILDWEEELQLLETKPSKTVSKTKSKPTEDDLQLVGTIKPSKETEKEKLERSADPLMRDARNKLNYYLKKIPAYSSLDSQAKLLQVEMNNYK